MNADSEFRRGWRVVVAGLVGDISFAITPFGLAASFMAPYVGSLTDRIGLRPVTLGSLVVFGVSFASL